ncbi:unnamed protein product, partial [Rotaria magnacalcarata]
IENNNNNTVHQIPSPPPPPIQTKEQRPKSSSKRQHSARHDRTQNDLPPTTGNSSITEKLGTTPVESSISSTSMIRSNTFEKKLESPRLPIETISTPPKP